MYDPALVQPMREELTKLGISELRSPEEVDEVLKDNSGSVLVVVNSVCGCAAGGARPGVALAMKHSKLPDKITTVFAGQDKDATERARSYFTGYPPSSPSMALIREGQVVHMLHRQDIEGKTPEQIAAQLTGAFDQHL